LLDTRVYRSKKSAERTRGRRGGKMIFFKTGGGKKKCEMFFCPREQPVGLEGVGVGEHKEIGTKRET